MERGICERKEGERKWGASSDMGGGEGEVQTVRNLKVGV